MRVSDYRASGGEANFGKPIRTQVAGGSHITFELITKRDETFYATRWPSGLPGHDDPPNTLRFPHGLIRVGESLEECAERLVREQLGMLVRQVRMLYWDSYMDGLGHWHVEPGALVEVAGEPDLPRAASKIETFTTHGIPDLTYWSQSDFLELVQEYLPDLQVK